MPCGQNDIPDLLVCAVTYLSNLSISVPSIKPLWQFCHSYLLSVVIFLSLFEVRTQKVNSYNVVLAGLNISQRPFQILLLAIHWSPQKTIHSDLEFLLELGDSLVIGLGCTFICSSFSKWSSCFVSLIACPIFLPVKATHIAEESGEDWWKMQFHIT